MDFPVSTGKHRNERPLSKNGYRGFQGVICTSQCGWCGWCKPLWNHNQAKGHAHVRESWTKGACKGLRIKHFHNKIAVLVMTNLCPNLNSHQPENVLIIFSSPSILKFTYMLCLTWVLSLPWSFFERSGVGSILPVSCLIVRSKVRINMKSLSVPA